MAFNMVNTEVLVKRLRIMGMPVDLINLIREWLVGRSFYVQVGDNCYNIRNVKIIILKITNFTGDQKD